MRDWRTLLQGKPAPRCFVTSTAETGIEAARIFGKPVGVFQGREMITYGQDPDDEDMLARGLHKVHCTGPAAVATLLLHGYGCEDCEVLFDGHL
jgi:hypothetical protein